MPRRPEDDREGLPDRIGRALRVAALPALLGLLVCGAPARAQENAPSRQIGDFWTQDLPWYPPGGTDGNLPHGDDVFDAGAAAGSFAFCATDPEVFLSLETLGLAGLDVGEGIVVVNSFDPAVAIALLDPTWLSIWLPEVCSVEPDWLARAPEGSQANAIVVGSEFGRGFDDQDALKRIRAHRAHRKATGQGTVVAVLDTGIDPGHPFFDGKLLPGHDFVDLDEDPTDEPRVLDRDGDGVVDEAYGHGTIVAGLVLAAAPDARILPVRVLDSEGVGTTSRVAAAIRWAVGEGADVINLSLGMRGRSSLLDDAVREAHAAGVVLVAAAGNDGRRAADFPARLSEVVSVSAEGVRRRRAGFANGGRRTVVAPGRDLIGPFPGGTWAKATGTSFAAPLVSAGAALARDRFPNLSADAIHERLRRGARLKLPRVVR